jgi:GNAT superfamily N-acetyltransferase
MVTIHRVTGSQAGELSRIAFAAKAHWDYPERWMDLWRPQLTFSADYFEQNESWAAMDGTEPVAFYTLQENNGKAWLENLWVLPEYMGKGVGAALFRHAADLARQRGYKKLQLEADPNATGFYIKMGMQPIGERRYELEGQWRILPIMELEL